MSNPGNKFRDLLANPSPISSFTAKIPPLVNPVLSSMEANYASEFYERLSKLINAFDKELDEQHEVGIRLVSFGQTIVFHLTSMGYFNPSLITFSGITDGGEPVELIQHVSQISILLMKLPRLDPDSEKGHFGFSPPAPEPA